MQSIVESKSCAKLTYWNQGLFRKKFPHRTPADSVSLLLTVDDQKFLSSLLLEDKVMPERVKAQVMGFWKLNEKARGTLCVPP